MKHPIEIGGQQRFLRYDLNALATIGSKLGIKIRLAHVQEDLLETPIGLDALRTILWAGFLHESPDLEEIEVGTWVDQDSMEDVLNDFFAVFGSTSPDLQDAAKSGLAAATGVEIGGTQS